MSENSPETAVPQPSRLWSARIVEGWQLVVHLVPPKWRIAALAGTGVLILMVLYVVFTSGTSTLNVVCRHNLSSANLEVFINGKLYYSDQISGGSKKQFGIFQRKVEGTFSKSLAVPSGQHVVEVHLRSAADGFDQSKRCAVNLLSGKEATLQVTAQRNGISLVYQGPRVGAVNEASTDYGNAARSFLFTAIGSAFSAAVGYMVQEFFRSRKAALQAQKQNTNPPPQAPV